MKKAILVLSAMLVMTMLVSLIAFAGEETVFSGNLRLHYNKLYNDTADEWNEDFFGLHFVEIRAKKEVGDMGVFVNERIGDGNANYLYEGWVSYKIGKLFGTGCTLKAGLVPVPFGIFANGLYYPKGILYAKNWMWDYDYGVRYDGKFKLGEAAGLNIAAAYLSRENSAGELSAFAAADCAACTGERDTISGRLGVDLNAGGLAIKPGGSVQFGKLMREDQEDDDSKVGVGGDVTIDLGGVVPIPVALLGEFVNYSLADEDTAKGNIISGQLDLTPVKGMGPLDAAVLSLHLGMNMPKEGSSVTNLIGQLKLSMCKQFHIFIQGYGDTIEDEDGMKNKGIRVWLMYVF